MKNDGYDSFNIISTQNNNFTKWITTLPCCARAYSSWQNVSGC